MFKYLLAFFALVAIAFAVPAPDANPSPNPKPLVYSAYGAYSAPYAYSPYAYSAPGVYAGVPAAYTYY